MLLGIRLSHWNNLFCTTKTEAGMLKKIIATIINLLLLSIIGGFINYLEDKLLFYSANTLNEMRKYSSDTLVNKIGSYMAITLYLYL